MLSKLQKWWASQFGWHSDGSPKAAGVVVVVVVGVLLECVLEISQQMLPKRNGHCQPVSRLPASGRHWLQRDACFKFGKTFMATAWDRAWGFQHMENHDRYPVCVFHYHYCRYHPVTVFSYRHPHARSSRLE